MLDKSEDWPALVREAEGYDSRFSPLHEAENWRSGAGRIPVHGMPEADEGGGLFALLTGFVLGGFMGIGFTLLAMWLL